MSIQSVVFDLDGTLIDTSKGIVEAIAHTIEELKLPMISKEELFCFVGPPLKTSFINLYGCSEEKGQEATNIFREYYKNVSMLKALPYDGIYDLCEDLSHKGIKMAVATNKREDLAVDILKHFKLDRYFDVIHGSDNQGRLLKEELVQKCVIEMGTTLQGTVLIGDTVGDADAAEKARVKFMGVCYGFGFTIDEKRSKDSTFEYAENTRDLMQLLTKLIMGE